MAFRKKSGGRGIYVLVLIVLLGWAAFQLVSLSKLSKDPTYLLYDVSRFQAEMTLNQLNGAAQSTTTDDLSNVLQALYSFRYSHSTLVQATSGKIPDLKSNTQMIDLIFRWQLGGNRALSGEEKAFLRSAYNYYTEMYGYYNQLMEGRTVDSSAAAKLSEIDRQFIQSGGSDRSR